MFGTTGALPLKIGGGQIVKDQIDFGTLIWPISEL
jgi:hypothetical protein